MKIFLNKLFTFKNLSKFIIMFLIGIMLRYFINECLHINIFIEYLGPIVIIISSILNFLFIESWLCGYCKLYGYGLATSYINNPNKSVDQYNWEDFINVDNYSNCPNTNVSPNQNSDYNRQYYNPEYYDTQGRITINKPSELSNYNISPNVRKTIVSQLFEEIAQPTKFREVVISSNNSTGNIYLGIRYCDKPSNAYGLYVKYYNLFNQEYTWNVWDKDSSGLEFSQIESIIHPKINIWKEIKDTTGTNVSKEVRKLLKTDPFHINKHN